MNLSPEARALYEKLKKNNPAVLEALKQEHMKEFRFRKQMRALAGLHGKLALEEESPNSLVDAIKKRARVMAGLD
ncbi:hypothetical protein ES703_78527 [subsurface metagenome]